MFRKFLSCALAIFLTLTITGNLAASARVPSPVTWKSVESRVGPVILAASGKSPKLLRPTFNKVARPVARQPTAGKRVRVSRNIGRPVVAKSNTAGRIRGISLPRANQRVSVSPTAERKFTQAVKPATAALAKHSITNARKNAALLKIRQNKISTAKVWQSAKPRNLTEQILMQQIHSAPEKAVSLPGLNNDPRFRSENGWSKMQITFRTIKEKSITDKGTVISQGVPVTARYQYNKITKQVDDIKYVGNE